MTKNPWVLPEGIEELLPREAHALEMLRRKSLDLMMSWGYALVAPPPMEYIDSLLVGLGQDLDLQTIKVIDQQSGRLMGIRADMTPQVARIDAHSHAQEGTARYCYAGTVIHSRQDDFGSCRSPIQLGAELYGDACLKSDLEVLTLLDALLLSAGCGERTLDIGHVGFARSLVELAELPAEQEATFYRLLQQKANQDIAQLLQDCPISGDYKTLLKRLPDWAGDRSLLAKVNEEIRAFSSLDLSGPLQALMVVEDFVRQLRETTNAQLHIDLAEIQGYQYHTGIVFSVYVPGYGQAVARGGRYDGIGQAFGRARPATGFSTELNTLLSIRGPSDLRDPPICAPFVRDKDLMKKIQTLRAEGQAVVYYYDQDVPQTLFAQCNRQLVCVNGEWVVDTLP